MKKLFNLHFAICVVLLALACANFIAPAQAQTTAAKQNAPAITTKLSENGRALMPIIVAADASPKVREAAQALADYLGRISGGEFKVETGAASLAADTKGIAVGLASQFGEAAKMLETDDPTRREDYILRSHASGVLVVGATELGVRHAVWDFLHRLGYRQFFPGEKWEIVPSEKNLGIAVNIHEHPDYVSRRIWVDLGMLPENKRNYQAWEARNRLGNGIDLHTGHAYSAIIRRNKAEFIKHPEYLAGPGSAKFCVSNPGLQQLVVNDIMAQIEKNPDVQSVSIDPSDGAEWNVPEGACRDGEIYKNITDRAVTLANIVAEAVTKKYPEKLVGIYAYNEHSPPPTIKVHPSVVVSIATGFITGGFTLDQLIEGWSAKATTIGIREYYAVTAWDKDLPGDARASSPSYMARTIPYFHKRGARFLNSQTSDSAGPLGLGHYVAARMLWDVDEAGRVEELKTDFLSKAFGSARAPMTEFYRVIDGSRRPLLSSDLIGRMYAQLDLAFKATDDAAVRARLHDLALYTRFSELFMAYASEAGADRQAAFEQLMRFTWRIRDTQMVHTFGLWKDLVVRDKSVKFPPGGGQWAKNDPWKSDEPFSAEQVQKFISEGVANNPLVDFEAVSFSRDLVPATPLKLQSKKVGSFVQVRGSTNLYTWIDKAPATISLQGSGGWTYSTRGPSTFSLFPLAETAGESVATQVVAPDKKPVEVLLATTFTGLHRINIQDNGGTSAVSWPKGTPMTVAMPATLYGGRWSMYFYVPKGTKVVGGSRKGGLGRILDSDGKAVKTFGRSGESGYWSVPVGPGQDGKLWMLDNMVGGVTFLTVPPYLARSADELLLPKEVVEADTPR